MTRGTITAIGRDKSFSAGNLQVNSAGTQLTATVTVNNAAPGPRFVVVRTPGGISVLVATTANTITVVQ
jgi:hypothetical protein